MNYTTREKVAILRRTALRKSGLNTARAWALKEPAMALGTRPIGTVIGHRIMTPLRPRDCPAPSWLLFVNRHSLCQARCQVSPTTFHKAQESAGRRLSFLPAWGL